MNTKPRLLIVLFIVLLVVASYFLFLKDNTYNEEVNLIDNGGSENTGFNPDPRNATFVFSDGPITLSKGRAEMSIAPNSAFVEDIFLNGQVAYGDINKDNKNDAVVFIVRSGAGSGSFVYVAGYVSGNTGYNGSQAVLLGDRISPQNISISNNIVTVEYLDREEGAPFAAEPTIAVTKRYTYQNGQLNEI